MNYHQLTTVICPTSPSPSHPDTRIIDETLRSIRNWFPMAPIRILADGVRTELAHREPAYREYLKRLADKIDERTTLNTFPQHSHQTAMVKTALPHVDTPLLLFAESDLPIRTDVATDWQMMADAILSGRVDLCRLMLRELVIPEHEHLFRPPLDDYPHLRPTVQWSGNTHLASTAMYRRLLAGYDQTRGLLMVERYVAGIVEAGGWEQWKLTAYIPNPIAARRIYHLHNRGGIDGQPDDQTFVETERYLPR